MSQNLEATVGIVTLLTSAVGFGVSQYRKRKRISYRVHLDTQLGDAPDHVVERMMEEALPKGWPAKGPELVLPIVPLNPAGKDQGAGPAVRDNRREARRDARRLPQWRKDHP